MVSGSLCFVRERLGKEITFASSFSGHPAPNNSPNFFTQRIHTMDKANRARLEHLGHYAEHYRRHLGRSFQAKLIVYGFVPFEERQIIDDKGDSEYANPHLFIDFGANGPFKYFFPNIVQIQPTTSTFQP
jgi:hypothetical protein